MASARYDTIGQTYARFRHTEPTWRREIVTALGSTDRVLNVGAGTGNYENLDTQVVALEPSRVMIEQRGLTAAPCVQGVAESLPFASDSFDATMGVLTMHHWTDRTAAFAELARVAPRHVYTVYDTALARDFWLFDYFPETRVSPMEVNAPTPTLLDQYFDVVDVRTLWVPRDCREGFAAAAWARPHEYLDPDRQQAISMLAMCDPHVRRRGTEQLRADLESGAWVERYAEIAELDRADFGYRLVTARRR